MNEQETKIITYISIGLTILAGIILISGSFFSVDAGQQGIVLRFGAIQGEYGEGLHFKAPLIDSVVLFDNTVIKTEVKAASYSKDAQTVDMLVAINYRIGKSPAEIYRTTGADYANKVVAPAIQDSVKKVVAQYDAQTLLDKYSEVSQKINQDLSERMKQFGINVVGVNIVNHEYSDAFEVAIEQKQLATQQALKAENDLKRIQIEALQQISASNATAQATILKGQADASAQFAIKKSQADGDLLVAQTTAQSKLLIAQSEAEALRLQKEQITPELLELRTIDVQKEYATHWDGALPQTMLGNSPIPVLQLPQSLVTN